MRLFNLDYPEYTDLFQQFANHINNEADSSRANFYRVPLNISEFKDYSLVELAVPGFTNEEIHLSLDNDHLIIEGRSEIKKDSSVEHLRREFVKRNFKRHIQLSDQVDIENISAHLKDGILKVKIGKKNPELKKRKIDIQ